MVRRHKTGGAITRSMTRRASTKRGRKQPSAAAVRLIKRGYSLRDASRIIAAASFHASSKARANNPRLSKVKGINNPHRYFFN